MSAWTVERGHIDVLVAALHFFEVPTKPDVGQMLWEENYRSVNYRYDENERTPTYAPPENTRALHPVAVLKAIDCYEYQSCEHPDWKGSQAHALCLALREAIYRRHPALAVPMPSRYGLDQTEPAYCHHPTYETAPWGFTSLAQAYEKDE